MAVNRKLTITVDLYDEEIDIMQTCADKMTALLAKSDISLKCTIEHALRIYALERAKAEAEKHG